MSLTPASVYSFVSASAFVGFVVTALSGALMAVISRRLVRSVCGLALAFLGLAGLYFYLHSPFLALMQILIYVGAICITIMFALMLTDPQDQPNPNGRNWWQEVAGLVVAGMLAIGLTVLLGRAEWMPAAAQTNADTIRELGRALLYRYGLAFELISVVLLLAILGALVVARAGRRAKS